MSILSDYKMYHTLLLLIPGVISYRIILNITLSTIDTHIGVFSKSNFLFVTICPCLLKVKYSAAWMSLIATSTSSSPSPSEIPTFPTNVPGSIFSAIVNSYSYKIIYLVLSLKSSQKIFWSAVFIGKLNPGKDRRW